MGEFPRVRTRRLPRSTPRFHPYSLLQGAHQGLAAQHAALSSPSYLIQVRTRGLPRSTPRFLIPKP